MDVLVAGGHGKVGLRLLARLAGRGHRARGLIRNPDHAPDLEAVGAEPVLCDLERDDPGPHVAGADAIVFAAGAGPGSGPERKRTVDYGGARKLIDAALEHGVRRYLMVSSMGTDDIEHAQEAMRPYLQAKADADRDLRASGLDWTIVHPGSLTDDPGTGRVTIAPRIGRWGDVPRDDVAAVLAECLDVPGTIRAEFELISGDTPIPEAVRAVQT
jgi:uncharacterized protein YbjT (DUF2867 family)